MTVKNIRLEDITVFKYKNGIVFSRYSKECNGYMFTKNALTVFDEELLRKKIKGLSFTKDIDDIIECLKDVDKYKNYNEDDSYRIFRSKNYTMVIERINYDAVDGNFNHLSITIDGN